MKLFNQYYWKFIFLALILKIVFNFYNPYLFNKINHLTNIKITIEEGSSANKIINQLYSNKLIPSKFWLKWYLKYHRLETQLKKGNYRFDKNISPQQIIEKITLGQVIENRFVILEGWKFSDLKKYINNKKNIQKQIINLPKNQIAKKLKIPKEFLDGAFLPDTYYYTQGDSDLVILQRARNYLNNYLITLQQKGINNSRLSDKYQILSLASIIEKESLIENEEPTISGVYHNRLQKGMRLEADPTVIYALGDKYKGNIKRKHIRKKHPYNTYVIKGLPPFPIAYSSRSAIEAALNPQKHSYLYFVATGDGSHYFSKTYEIHKKAIDKYIFKKQIALP